MTFGKTSLSLRHSKADLRHLRIRDAWPTLLDIRLPNETQLSIHDRFLRNPTIVNDEGLRWIIWWSSYFYYILSWYYPIYAWKLIHEQSCNQYKLDYKLNERGSDKWQKRGCQCPVLLLACLKAIDEGKWTPYRSWWNSRGSQLETIPVRTW